MRKLLLPDEQKMQQPHNHESKATNFFANNRAGGGEFLIQHPELILNRAT